MRERLRELVDAGEVESGLAGSLRAAAEFIKASLARAIRLAKARRESGGTLAIDEFLNKSLGIEQQAAHAKAVVAEAERIFGEEVTGEVTEESSVAERGSFDPSDPSFALKARTDKPTSWDGVKPGHSWNSAKQYLPRTGEARRPFVPAKRGSWKEIIKKVADWLGSVNAVKDMWGRKVLLANPENKDDSSLEGRAAHLTGEENEQTKKRIGLEQLFLLLRKLKLGLFMRERFCISETTRKELTW